ncbi:aldehyde dehydrogenase family protein [Streptomyces sp. 4N509B]|uniref:aldehyde dehydrogenase family protein n=1 Tax=Streptomyces sp. 4N509B TaxID=3457413 RepID=UPI003FD0D97E
MSAATLRASYGLHLGGEESHPGELGSQPTIDPASGEPLATVAVAGPADVARAVAAAARAAPAWRETSWQRRAAVLTAVADRIEAEAESWALLDVRDAGIPIRGMRRDVANALAYLRYFAGLAGGLPGGSTDVGTDGLSVLLREPYGVVGRIVPFNHPLQFAAQAIAAPLAAGNAVILKPAEQTPLSALHLAELLAELVPPGTVNVLPGGAAAGAALVGHPGVPRIGFTGSVATGRAVLRGAAEHIKAVTLELGGKNPMLVLPDADLDVSVDLALDGMNLQRTAGQSCGSTSRVYVPADRAEDFAARLATAVAALRVGDPSREDTEVGPLAYAAHQRRVLAAVATAVAEGARLLTGGHAVPEAGGGFYVAPAVLDRVTEDMEIAAEEVFGPVVAVLSYDDLDDAVARANRLPLGLTANVVTGDLSAALALSHRLQAGYVWVNGRGQRPFGAPFGGHKLSGLGQENSLEEIMSYTQPKNVTLSPFPTRPSARRRGHG